MLGLKEQCLARTHPWWLLKWLVSKHSTLFLHSYSLPLPIPYLSTNLSIPICLQLSKFTFSFRTWINCLWSFIASINDLSLLWNHSIWLYFPFRITNCVGSFVVLLTCLIDHKCIPCQYANHLSFGGQGIYMLCVLKRSHTHMHLQEHCRYLTIYIHLGYQVWKEPFYPKVSPYIPIKGGYKLIYSNIVSKSDVDSKHFTFPQKYKNILFL